MPSEPTLNQLYRTMVPIRHFEERCEVRYAGGEIYGSLHLCIGQQATAAGACAAVPLPYSRPLENAALPSSDTIAAALLAAVERSEIG